MWVEKSPQPSYFCGCPPCPICFDWVEDNGASITGIAHVVKELTGKPIDQATPEEIMAVSDGIEKIHAANLAGITFPVETREDAIARRTTEIRMEGFLKEKRIVREPPKKLNTITCDDIDMEGALVTTTPPSIDSEIYTASSRLFRSLVPAVPPQPPEVNQPFSNNPVLTELRMKMNQSRTQKEQNFWRARYEQEQAALFADALNRK